jgi:hypothetical protein
VFVYKTSRFIFNTRTLGYFKIGGVGLETFVGAEVGSSTSGAIVVVIGVAGTLKIGKFWRFIDVLG